jgi:DNA-binding LacI/PurR family transcriptional regulator
MATESASAATPPRWKTIHDELCAMLPQHSYGSSFYTIADICKKYDVSSITARRVLDELQAQGLVEKIRKRGTVVRRLPQATSVRLVAPAATRSDYMTYSPVMRRMIAGITRHAQQHHIDFDITSEQHLQTLFSRRHEGFGLLLPPPQIADETIAFIRRQGLPHVFLTPMERWKGLPHARPDRIAAARLATEHLIQLGHRRIAYLLGDIRHRNFRDRLVGYRQALVNAGLKLDWQLVHQTNGLIVEQDEMALDELLALRRPPTAIITADDDYRAIHVLESLRRRGIRVPEQISVLGYPNYPDSRLTDPPLSVVDANYEAVGAAAMRLLMSQMHEGADPATQFIVIAPTLVSRSSVAPPASKPGPV